MKQPKKLTRKMKILMDKKGYDATKYMLADEDKQTFTAVHKESREFVVFPKK